jgi:hypothetical protein
MKLLLADLENLVGIYDFHIVEENGDFFVVDNSGSIHKRVIDDDGTVDFRITLEDNIYHFRVSIDKSRKVLTSYLGNFCVDTLSPVEEYRVIEKRTGMSYAKKTYSLGKAVKLEEFTTGNDYYKTSIGYEKDGYISTEKTLVRFGDDLLSTTGLYEMVYGSEDDTIYNYIAKISKDSLSLCEINDEEFIRESQIGEHLNNDEIRRCIKAFVSSKESQSLLTEVQTGMPKNLKNYFGKILDRLDELVLTKEEDIKYIDNFFKELEQFEVLKSNLEDKTKENVVRLVRCEF